MQTAGGAHRAARRGVEVTELRRRTQRDPRFDPEAADVARGGGQEVGLEIDEVQDVLGRAVPAEVGAFGEDAQPGARRVEQHAVAHRSVAGRRVGARGEGAQVGLRQLMVQITPAAE